MEPPAGLSEQQVFHLRLLKLKRELSGIGAQIRAVKERQVLFGERHRFLAALNRTLAEDAARFKHLRGKEDDG